MKKMMTIAAMTLSLFTTAAQASADYTTDNYPFNYDMTYGAAPVEDGRVLWACTLAFEGEAYGIQFIIGMFRSEAYGAISCTDSLGGHYYRPVRITMETRPLALSIGIGDFHFAGAAAQISLFNVHPDVLLGNYVVAQGHLAFIGGIGAFTAAKAGLPQLSLQMSLQVGAGWGAHVGLQGLRIEALN